MMTEAGLAKLLEEQSGRIASEPNYHWVDEFRWGWWEWRTGYEFIGDHSLFDAMNSEIKAVLAPHFTNNLLEGAVRERMAQMSLNILAKLDKDGVFGQGAERETALIYPCYHDGGLEQWSYESAERLNPLAAWQSHCASFKRCFVFLIRPVEAVCGKA